MKCNFLLALAAGAMSAVFAQQAAAQPERTVGTAGYMTIQNAVDEVARRKNIVPAGTYIENVIIGRSVTIRGAGPKLTTVGGSGDYGTVFLIQSPPSNVICTTSRFATLEGMTITGGQGPPDSHGAPIQGAASASMPCEDRPRERRAASRNRKRRRSSG